MTVSDIWTDSFELKVTGTGYAPMGEIIGAEHVQINLYQMPVASGCVTTPNWMKDQANGLP